MEQQHITSPQTGDSYNYIKHPSGLDILVWEMEGFHSTEALFGTKYGSINTSFKTKADTDICTVPEGIAHFLEHKLFENESCDAFDQFAKTGADSNAYTSFDKTCYLFSCSANYKEALEILLSFVQEPYFTEESVAKEQGIIGQELRMLNDTPSWRVFLNLLCALYHNHPVRIDIGGTEESIAKIDADLLYRCYNTFYNLNNMVLAIAGNVKTEEVLAIADRLLKPCEDKGLQTFFPDEPDSVAQSEIVLQLPVGQPIFQIGFKSKPETGYACLKAELAAQVAANVLADPASPLYQRMTDAGLINSEFASEVFTGDGYFAVVFGGESEQPREVLACILAEIEAVKRDGLDRAHFESVKKATYGSMLREFNNVEAVASTMINSHFAGVLPFDGLKALQELTYEDVQSCLTERFCPERVAISIVEGSSTDGGAA